MDILGARRRPRYSGSTGICVATISAGQTGTTANCQMCFYIFPSEYTKLYPGTRIQEIFTILESPLLRLPLTSVCVKTEVNTYRLPLTSVCAKKLFLGVPNPHGHSFSRSLPDFFYPIARLFLIVIALRRMAVRKDGEGTALNGGTYHRRGRDDDAAGRGKVHGNLAAAMASDAAIRGGMRRVNVRDVACSKYDAALTTPNSFTNNCNDQPSIAKQEFGLYPLLCTTVLCGRSLGLKSEVQQHFWSNGNSTDPDLVQSA
ncbi:hypothetical protein C8J57DRAFT_1238120 [Mycena rebaudengoi]|nr:hypothetical protein C8J57DRAFT_1238120 [Mycena rebaudengoi]